jgi:photosystem II stability/assembly factor-like uncharacterized protein
MRRRLKVALIGILFCLSVNAFGQSNNVTPGLDFSIASVGPEGGIILSVAIDPHDSGTIYAATWAGVFKSKDGGANWTATGLMGFAIGSVVVDPQNQTTVYASTLQYPDDDFSTMKVFRSVNGGSTWSEADSGLLPPNNCCLNALVIDPWNSGTIYAGTQISGPDGSGGSIYKSTDGGTNWQLMSFEQGAGVAVNAMAIDPQNPGNVYAAGSTGTGGFSFKRSTDGGASWTRSDFGFRANIIGMVIDPRNPKTIYLTSFNYGIFKSIDGGASWNPLSLGRTNAQSLESCCLSSVVIDAQNTSTLYASRTDGIFRSTDAGTTWNVLPFVGRPNSVRALTADPHASGTVYAATSQGAFKSTDYGATWTVINSGLRAMDVMSVAVDTKNPGTMYVGTDFFGVFKSTDNGKSWGPASSGIDTGYPTESVVGLAVDSQTPGTVHAATGGVECGTGELPGIYKSMDGGTTWSDTKPSASCLSALIMDPENSNRLYAGSWYQGVVESTDAGTSWTPANSGLPAGVWGVFVSALAIASQNSGVLYASVGVATNQGLFKSTNGGGGWVPVNSGLPAYPNGANIEATALAIDPQNIRTVYAAFAPYNAVGGGLYTSPDEGGSWRNLFRPPTANVYSVAINPQDSRTIYTGTDAGASWSTDGGQTWAPAASTIGRTRLLKIDPLNPNNLYAGGPGGLFAVAPRIVTGISFDTTTVSSTGSFNATIAGSNLNSQTYFDLLVRPPGAASDVVALNWQMGTTASHPLSSGIALGTWTVSGVRAHQDPADHTASLAPVSATITVSP